MLGLTLGFDAYKLSRGGLLAGESKGQASELPVEKKL